MPLYKGCTQTQASEALAGEELDTTFNPVPDPSPAGIILDQTPAPGVAISRTSTFTFTISKGPAPPSQADLSLGGSLLTAGPHPAGQSVGFLFLVTNTGPGAATGVVLNGVPQGLSEVHVSGDCQQLPCGFDNLPPNSGRKIFVNATIASDGQFGEDVTVTSRTSDPDTSNNRADPSAYTSGTAASSQARPVIFITGNLQNKNAVHVGDPVDIDFEVSNIGGRIAEQVHLNATWGNLVHPVLDGSCALLPCNLLHMTQGDRRLLHLHATVGTQGPFFFLLTAHDRGLTQTPDMTRRVSGTALPVLPRPAWLLRLSGFTFLAFVALVGTWSLRRIRQEKLRSSMQVSVALEHFSAAPVSFSTPPLGISVSLLHGPAGPVGPIPVLKEDSFHV